MSDTNADNPQQIVTQEQAFWFFNELQHELHSIFDVGKDNIMLVGSAGVVSRPNDVDVVMDSSSIRKTNNSKTQTILVEMQKAGYTAVMSSNTVTIQYSSGGKLSDVDIYISDNIYDLVQYFSGTNTMSKYSGIHRNTLLDIVCNQIMHSPVLVEGDKIITYKTYKMFHHKVIQVLVDYTAWGAGTYKHTVTDQFGETIKFIFGDHITTRCIRDVESIIDVLMNEKDRFDLQHISNEFKRVLKGEKGDIQIPDQLGQYCTI